MKIYAGIVSPVVMFTNVYSLVVEPGLRLQGPEKRNDNSLLSQLSRGERGEETAGERVGLYLLVSKCFITPRFL